MMAFGDMSFCLRTIPPLFSPSKARHFKGQLLERTNSMTICSLSQVYWILLHDLTYPPLDCSRAVAPELTFLGSSEQSAIAIQGEISAMISA